MTCKESELNKANAVKTYTTAKACCEAAGKKAALEFVCQNFKDVSGEAQFVDLLNAEQLGTIITSRQLVANTATIFNAVVRWANKDYKARGRDQLEGLLKKIPFAAASPDDSKAYLCDSVIRRSARLTNLMCDLWDAAAPQRPITCAENRWCGDISSLFKCPVKDADVSFYFVRQGYLFQMKATAHKHFGKHGKGLDVFLRVCRAEGGWKHSNHALRQLHVRTSFWVNIGCKEPSFKSTSEHIDLMALKKGKEEALWYGIEGFIPCEKFCEMLDKDGISLGFRLDVEKVRTAGACPKEEKPVVKCDSCCCCPPKKEEKKAVKCTCCAPKKEEKKKEEKKKEDACCCCGACAPKKEEKKKEVVCCCCNCSPPKKEEKKKEEKKKEDVCCCCGACAPKKEEKKKEEVCCCCNCSPPKKEEKKKEEKKKDEGCCCCDFCTPKKVEKKKEPECTCCCGCAPPKAKDEKKDEKKSAAKCSCLKECEAACKKACADVACCATAKKDCEAKCEKTCAGKCEHKCSCGPKPKDPPKKACTCAKCKPKAEEKKKDEKEQKCTCCEKGKGDADCTAGCTICVIKTTSEICKPKKSDKHDHGVGIFVCC